jgi:hypothetical protein
MKRLIYAIAVIALIIAGYFLYIYWALGNDSASQPRAGDIRTYQ